MTPLSTLPPLREQLEANQIDHRIDVLAWADHGYSMPRTPAYEPSAAARAWSETTALLRRRLV